MSGVIKNAIRFLREQFTDIPVPTGSLKGKTIVVVGANVGLGFEAAKRLAQLEPDRLVVTSRDATKGEEAKKLIGDGANSGELSLSLVDFSSFDSVRAFADEIADGGNAKLDSLLINAGVATSIYAPTSDGWEKTLQVNYLSNALLSILLLPTLIKSATADAASRLLIVSSDAHYLATLDDVKKSPNIVKELSDPKYCTQKNMDKLYYTSKLLGVMFVESLAARLPRPTPVAVLAVNPGFCHSKLTREADERPLKKYVIRSFKAIFARTTEVGSRTLVHSVIDPDERAFHGHFVSTCKVVEESDYLRTEEGKALAGRVWTETLEILEGVDPRVKQIVSEYLSSPAGQST
ncbi:Short-chain dehydrogenase/reductase tropG [Sparassis crispa]|uniref:Short-chain dehydrogenase/reductase tropG n=1 Tax=Sparassis crispa TaxID=139825 RepID=A0A401GDF1_9APHY|nr:Short-chain dehydrogenase/reductase tropG [Sparassis crispa]GBE80161.1 Short-chain dehydrogenase/reductase tropG [Sparassis crispa]